MKIFQHHNYSEFEFFKNDTEKGQKKKKTKKANGTKTQ